MFKFLRKLRQKKNDTDFENGYTYAASCLLKLTLKGNYETQKL